MLDALLGTQHNRLPRRSPAAFYCDLTRIMKQKKIETHKIGLVGQAPSRRGDPRKPLAGPRMGRRSRGLPD
jgi:hypothetical protein